MHREVICLIVGCLARREWSAARRLLWPWLKVLRLQARLTRRRIGARLAGMKLPPTPGGATVSPAPLGEPSEPEAVDVRPPARGRAATISTPTRMLRVATRMHRGVLEYLAANGAGNKEAAAVARKGAHQAMGALGKLNAAWEQSGFDLAAGEFDPHEEALRPIRLRLMGGIISFTRCMLRGPHFVDTHMRRIEQLHGRCCCLALELAKGGALEGKLFVDDYRRYLKATGQHAKAEELPSV